MLFNSIHFAIFLPIIFLVYWFIAKESRKLQNIILLAASLYFYACWDWRFLFLLVFSIAICYFTGIIIYQSKNQKQKLIWLWVSIGLNLGFLGFFKYYNFFVQSFADALSVFGVQANTSSLQLILPVGISFYTFHGLSYIIDIYKGRIEAERNFIDYSLFVSYFPLLVAGPIERATHLLPQIVKKREFNYAHAVEGLRQILWGLFKKIVIADNCAEYANLIFNNSADASGSTLVVGAFFFAIQIYCDFSGYSDIALGVSRLFGIKLLRNFAYPYFSRDIAEFWRRWHISLSSWFKDYVYIPLGGSKGGTWMRVRNTFIIFLVSGFWHGANWTFIVWGFLNALFIMPSIIFNKNRNNIEIVAAGKYLPTIKEFFSILITFCLSMFAWIFFRANNVEHAFEYIANLFSSSFFSVPDYAKMDKSYVIIFLVAIFMVIEWFGRENEFAIEKMGLRWPILVRWLFYFSIISLIFVFVGKEQEFIYFQF